MNFQPSMNDPVSIKIPHMPQKTLGVLDDIQRHEHDHTSRLNIFYSVVYIKRWCAGLKGRGGAAALRNVSRSSEIGCYRLPSSQRRLACHKSLLCCVPLSSFSRLMIESFKGERAYQVTTQEALSQALGSNRPRGGFESAQCQNRNGEKGKTVDCSLNLYVRPYLLYSNLVNENWRPDKFALGEVGNRTKKQNKQKTKALVQSAMPK